MSSDGQTTNIETPSTLQLLKHNRGQHSQSPQRPPKVSKSLGEDPRHIYDEEGEVEEESGVTDLGDIAQNQLMNSKIGMRRYLVAIEYNGTHFFGSQQQPTHRTVVGVLEEAFKKFIGQPVSILCSSRTDAGVHALSNVYHVDIERISKRKPGEVVHFLLEPGFCSKQSFDRVGYPNLYDYVSNFCLKSKTRRGKKKS
ncbi:hypothetical protein V2J09_001605 [Rumex salicifolius]